MSAIAPLNPVWLGDFPLEFDKPFFLLQGELDAVVGDSHAVVREIVERAASPRKVYLNLRNGGHFNATDACLLLPESEISDATGCNGDMIDPDLANRICSAYATAFFRAVLTADDRYVPYLLENRFPDDIDFASSWD